MATRTKKPIKLNVLGLFKLETENMTVTEVVIIMLIIMAFILAVIILLKTYSIPVLGTPGIIKKAGTVINFFKSRSP